MVALGIAPRPFESLDDLHPAPAARTGVHLVRRLRGRTAVSNRGLGWFSLQELPATIYSLTTMTVGEQAVMTNAMEAVRQHVQQEAPHELAGSERHYLGIAIPTIILPSKANFAVSD